MRTLPFVPVMGKQFRRSDIDLLYIIFNDGSTNATVDFNSYQFDTFCQAVLAAIPDGYNQFDADTFVREFKAIQGHVYKVRFGREGSPVAYLTFNWEVTEDEATAMLKSFSHADERSVSGGGSARGRDTLVGRVWWD